MSSSKKRVLDDETLTLYLAGALNEQERARIERLLKHEDYKLEQDRVERLQKFCDVDPSQLPSVEPPGELVLWAPWQVRGRPASLWYMSIGIAAVTLFACGLVIALTRSGSVDLAHRGGTKGPDQRGSVDTSWTVANIWEGPGATTSPIVHMPAEPGSRDLVFESNELARVMAIKVNRIEVKPLFNDWQSLSPGQTAGRATASLIAPDSTIGFEVVVAVYVLDDWSSTSLKPAQERLDSLQKEILRELEDSSIRRKLITCSNSTVRNIETELGDRIEGLRDVHIQIRVSAWARSR